MKVYMTKISFFQIGWKLNKLKSNVRTVAVTVLLTESYQKLFQKRAW